MTGNDPSEDRRPLTYVKGHPIYATTLLVALHIVTMILFALAMGLHLGGFLQSLTFSSAMVIGKGWVWQFVTYAFLNGPTIWFAVEMLLLFQFGREVEIFLGRRSFLRMYALLLLLLPGILTAASVFIPTHYQGSGALHFAVFVAFAIVYPGTPVFFGITARWVAWILIGIHTLQAISHRNLEMLISIWVTSGTAALYINFERGLVAFPSLPDLRFWRKRPKFYVVRDVRPLPITNTPGDEPAKVIESVDSIDPLLEKISRSGLSSLTAGERARLEQAREDLIKKEPPHK